ncbi:MAG: hypothetical protein E6Q97_17880 [Desulfurellales bacterium]|nr:MAG: hypothetical protein E6Q97_17880 [Desulfurellales bacterium]
MGNATESMSAPRTMQFNGGPQQADPEMLARLQSAPTATGMDWMGPPSSMAPTQDHGLKGTLQEMKLPQVNSLDGKGANIGQVASGMQNPGEQQALLSLGEMGPPTEQQQSLQGFDPTGQAMLQELMNRQQLQPGMKNTAQGQPLEGLQEYMKPQQQQVASQLLRGLSGGRGFWGG